MTQPILKPIVSQAEWHALQDAAAKDDHAVLAPTHLVLMDNEIVGYYSLAGIPLLNGWLHRERLHGHARALTNAAENVIWASGHRRLAMVISPDSQIVPHLGKLGYDLIGKSILCTKGI